MYDTDKENVTRRATAALHFLPYVGCHHQRRITERDNERKDGNPQASGTVRLQDLLNTVLLRDGGMNDAHTCETVCL